MTIAKHLTFLLALFICVSAANAQPKDVVEPVVKDKLERVTLNQKELGGEINRRINLLTYKNYMVVDLDKDWLDKFKNRTDRKGSQYVYYGIGKVIDAGSLLAEYTGDAKVVQRTQYLVDQLRSSRAPDGYLGFWNVEPGNLQDYINWILHEQEYINLGLVRNYRTTGNPQSLEDAKTMGDYIIKTFPTEENGFYDPSKICTAGLPEGFLELYRVTGDKRYLDFAANVRHGNGSSEVRCASLLTWKQDFKTRPCHVYVMLARTFAQTELYRLNSSDSLMQMSRFMKNEMLEKGRGALLITGSTSQGEHMTYNQNGAGNVQESCVTAYLLRWFDSLLRLEGDLKYGDIMERTIFNALFAAQEPCGRHISYFLCFTGRRSFQGGDTFCCNGNYRRAVAELPQKVYYRFADGGIALNLFTNSEKTFDVNGKSVTIKQETDYPNSGEVKLTLASSAPVSFPFRYRTPRWANTIACTVNGADVPVVRTEKGYAEIQREWKTGDTIHLSLSMDWRLIRGRSVQEGRVALMRGPVLFGFSTRLNPELSKKIADGRNLVIDPACIGLVERDDYVRPDGQKVSVKAWLNSDCSGEKVDVLFSEFVDDKCVSVYFKVPNLKNTAPIPLTDDELISEPQKTINREVVQALYGEKSLDDLPSAFVASAKCLADLAEDYVPPAGKQDLKAEFPARGGNGSWSLWLDGKPLSSSCKSYACPLGFAYGSPDSSELGFFANYCPSPHMANGWAEAYTEKIFDLAIPQESRNDYLYTHPVSDSGVFVIARWTPTEPLPINQIGVAGTLMARNSSDGVQLRVQYWNRENQLVGESVFYSAEGKDVPPVRKLEYFVQNGSCEKASRIDLKIGCNGSHICDSTALNARVYQTAEPYLKRDVTEKVKPLLSGKLQEKIGSFQDLFGDSTPDKPKSLTLFIQNNDTNTIEIKTFLDGEPIEL